MAGFVVYLDAPDGSAEPRVDLLNQIQEAVEHEHPEWSVRFDYTRSVGSNAPIYVGVSVSGGGFVEDPSPIIEAIKRIVAEVDHKNEIEVARTRHSTWDFG